jgi:hypothetical protein
MAPRKIEFEYEHVTFELHPTETWTYNGKEYAVDDENVPESP